MKKNVSTENVALLTVWNMKFLSVSVRIILFSAVSKHTDYNNKKNNHDGTLAFGVWDGLIRSNMVQYGSIRYNTVQYGPIWSNTVGIVYTEIWMASETGKRLE